jgi:Flp pilus assembly protein TadD
MKEFGEVLKQKPASVLADLGQGLVFLAGGQPAKAEEKFHRALELDSTLWEAYVCLGII